MVRLRSRTRTTTPTKSAMRSRLIPSEYFCLHLLLFIFSTPVRSGHRQIPQPGALQPPRHLLSTGARFGPEEHFSTCAARSSTGSPRVAPVGMIYEPGSAIAVPEQQLALASGRNYNQSHSSQPGNSWWELPNTSRTTTVTRLQLHQKLCISDQLLQLGFRPV